MKIKIFYLILIAIFMEYLRNYLFVNMNLQIQYLEFLSIDLNIYNYTDSKILNLLKNFDGNSLIVIKWIMSLLFSFIFFSLGFFFSKWRFELSKHKKFLRFFTIGGSLILLSSLIIFSLGKLLSLESQINFYYVSIGLSHFIQSSLYPISFLLIFYANNKTKISA